ncbi:hypothetical protein B7494_g8361 [Chlorociboria aeruginascens]|nr:hypothetical protein B7494_g8361 [Chlorociboria aeruginascens]
MPILDGIWYEPGRKTPAKWRMQKGGRVKGLARRTGDHNPRHWGLWIEEGLESHPTMAACKSFPPGPTRKPGKTVKTRCVVM